MMDAHDGRGRAKKAPYATRYHAPVLCNAVVAALVTDPAGWYIDATLGGGGHSAALLDVLESEGRVIGIDQDAEALTEAQARLQHHGERFIAVQANFADLERVTAEQVGAGVDGVLMDLGVSSHQLDAPQRGFSYRADGPLDMRMDPTSGQTAEALVNHGTVSDLAHILRAYGEEPRARRIAHRIVKARPITSTQALVDVVEACVPFRDRIKSLSRVFQALRIAVNDELDVLEQALHAALAVLNVGGRLAVISYHSLEDRRVKRFLRAGNFEGHAPRDFYGNVLTPWRLITRKPMMATSDEVAQNPRARSARLRVAEKQDLPATPDHP